MNRYFQLSIVSVFFIFVFTNGSGPVNAQAVLSEKWESTIIIGGEDIPGMWPMISVDPWERVHVIWTVPTDQQLNTGGWGNGLIIHRMKDEQGWSEPRDILVRDGWDFSHPRLTTTLDSAYLVWSQANGLFFSRAPVLQINLASAWEKPQLISSQMGIESSQILVDPQGIIHIVYSRLSPRGFGDGNVYYMYSVDNGDNWSSPEIISQFCEGPDVACISVRLAMDGQGGLHAVWELNAPPIYKGEAVFYTNRPSGVDYWTPPIEISQSNPENLLWQAAPSLAVDFQDTIHIVWTCGESPQRCYRFSDDDGRTWSGIIRIIEDYMSLAGYDHMLAGEDGTLHLIAQLRYPENVFHISKRIDQSWQEPPVKTVDLPSAFQAHYPEAAISHGNQLHIVAQTDKPGPIFYMHGILSLPEQSSRTLPVVTNTPLHFSNLPETKSAPTVPSVTTTSPSRIIEQPFTTNQSTSIPLLTATITSSIIILVVIAIQLLRKR